MIRYTIVKPIAHGREGKQQLKILPIFIAMLLVFFACVCVNKSGTDLSPWVWYSLYIPLDENPTEICQDAFFWVRNVTILHHPNLPPIHYVMLHVHILFLLPVMFSLSKLALSIARIETEAIVLHFISSISYMVFYGYSIMSLTHSNCRLYLWIMVIHTYACILYAWYDRSPTSFQYNLMVWYCSYVIWIYFYVVGPQTLNTGDNLLETLTRYSILYDHTSTN
jgi:hypothetical protein